MKLGLEGLILEARAKVPSLSELVDPERGITYGVVQPGAYIEDGVPISRVKDVRNGRIDSSAPLRIAPMIVAKHSRTVLRGGELLLTLVGTVGETAIVPPELEGWNTARAVAVIPVLDDPGAKWIQYSLETGAAKRYILDRLNTTVQATLNLRDVSTLPIPMLSESNRSRVLEVLGALDDKIGLNRKMNQTLEAMAQALFKSWFVDFDPVIDNALRAGNPIPKDLQAKAARRSKVMAKDSYEIPPYESLFPNSFEDSELGSIPRGWQVVKFSKVSESLNKKRDPVSKLERQKRQGRFPYYGASGIVDNVDSYIFEGEHLLISEDGENLRTRKTPIAFIATGRFWVNNHAHILLGRSGVSIEHLQLFFAQLDVDPYLSAAVQPKLSQRNLQRIPFLSGPAEVLSQFNEVVVGMFDSIRGKDAESEFLTALRDTLLPKLISGEVRVPASAVPGVAE